MISWEHFFYVVLQIDKGVSAEPTQRIHWTKNINGVWIPVGFAALIAGTLIELGRLLETIHEIQEGQSHLAITFSAEHDQIGRRIGDVERAIEDLKTAQAVDNEHTRQQDARIDAMERKK